MHKPGLFKITALTGIGCLLMFLLPACAKLGPATLKGERNHYNIAVQQTNDEQLLLNLIRLKYRDTPFFLEVSSIASQFTLKTNASVSAELPDTGFNIFTFGGGATYLERPTVTYSPLQGDKFIKRLLSPVPLKTLSLLYHSGWSIERIFRLCLQRMDSLKNAPSASGPTPERVPRFKGFVRVIKLFRALQTRGAFDMAFDTSHKIPGLALQISTEASGWPEVRELSGYLGAPPGQTRYLLTNNRIPSEPGQIRVVTRSLLGIMFYLSQAVEAPDTHKVAGKVTITRYESGEEFDWNLVTGDLLHVRSQSHVPDTASVAIYYRDHWFYIDDSDLSSKSTFSLLAQIFALQAGDAKDVSPMLTLPIGG
ncbi:MAG: hypothetical protein IID18_01385 [Nitrospinae bacterium]|nr:hypothetical protein [Nitrospinota bacterium]